MWKDLYRSLDRSKLLSVGKPAIGHFLGLYNFLNRLLVELVPEDGLAARQVLRRQRLLLGSPPVGAPVLLEA